MVEDIRLKGPKPFDYYLPLEIVNRRNSTTWSKKKCKTGWAKLRIW